MISTKIFQGKSLSRLAFNGNSRRHIHLANLYWLEPCRGNILLKKCFCEDYRDFSDICEVFSFTSAKNFWLEVTEDVIFAKNKG